jgi:hypothetical protein
VKRIATFLKKPSGGTWQDYTGADAKTLDIAYETSRLAELWLEQLGGEKQFGKLRLKNKNAKAGVAPGSYLLLYRGRTETPNEEISIEITDPKEAKWKPKPPETSDDACNVYGIQPVTIES